MVSRYYNREILANFDKKYSEILKKRNLSFIDQYESPKFRELTADDIGELDIVSHVWTIGDRFYKLADEFYGDSSLWWVIAWYNRMPTESHVKLGYIVDVPLPLEKILELWDR